MALIDRPRALVLRALGLGDLLTGVPALRAVRRALPDHHVVLAAPAVLDPLVRLADATDELLPTGGLEPLAWTGPAPDVAVNLHGRGPQSHALLQSLRPHRLVAYDCPAAGHDGPAWDDDEHEVRRWCRLVEESLGSPLGRPDLLLPVPRAAPDPFGTGAVVVHPGAAHPSRRWPGDRFAEVARWAAAAGHPVLVTGGPDEAALARRVAREAGLPESAVAAGRTDLLTLARLVATARLVVSGDTGVAHLATAFATPSVVLFGPVPPWRWGPPRRGPHTVLWHPSADDPPGDPWGEALDPALARITVEEVLAAVRLRLQPAGAGEG